MQLPAFPHFLATLFLWQPPLEISATFSARGGRGTPGRLNSVQNLDSNGTCEFRTINYITSILPKQCLKDARDIANITGGMAVPGMEGVPQDNITATVLNVTSSVLTGVTEQESPAITDVEAAQIEQLIRDRDNEQSTFLSFEEWKKQTLEKSGQKDPNSAQPKATNPKERETESVESSTDSLGIEKDIDLDFSHFKSGGTEAQARDNQVDKGEELGQTKGRREKESYRSKDAGKTCKERMSYASFDAGATVLKTHPGAKNAKNILIENKDSYMLSECSVENKFVIIELSEDIWIDTVVLANYEFFSSMIRSFRVSVSDRYPVKMEKWKDIGTYEARNSREIQAFLIENPQIWARYIRIEFLSHYGNEYYCPLSLVRVHGTRMLESWKETEAAGEDEDSDEIPEEHSGSVEEAATDVEEEQRINNNVNESGEMADLKNISNNSPDVLTQSMANKTPQRDPGYYIFNTRHMPYPEEMCLLDKSTLKSVGPESNSPVAVDPKIGTNIISKVSTSSSATASSSTTTENISKTSSNQPATPHQASTDTSHGSSSSSDINHSSSSLQTGHTSSMNSKNQTATTSTVPKNKTSTTSTSSSPLPTIQESFFKAVSRRLTLLESNSTLSLAYISEATSHLHHAFTSFSRDITRIQLAKTTIFLNTLNSTVFFELRKLRQQYDEIWQSTVISLETQRDENRQEILAVTERLNILAQEVVWQRRMNIVQSVLLLFCLGLVIFSRVSASSELFLLRPRSRFSMHYQTDAQRYNAESQSEPGSPCCK
ncbi:hypothetical protein K3495_g7098 [Podosphaera aphanis]|nr:hypothetical protein K3495_g7098 [Podosphaera aphanis]